MPPGFGGPGFIPHPAWGVVFFGASRGKELNVAGRFGKERAALGRALGMAKAGLHRPE